MREIYICGTAHIVVPMTGMQHIDHEHILPIDQHFYTSTDLTFLSKVSTHICNIKIVDCPLLKSLLYQRTLKYYWEPLHVIYFGYFKVHYI